MPPALLRRLSSQPQGGTERKERGHRTDKYLLDWPLPSLCRRCQQARQSRADTRAVSQLEADFLDEPLEEGDRIWATGLFPQAEHICATATVFQRLVEGFRQNSQPADHESTSRRTSATSTRYFPRTPSMNCPGQSHGTMPSSSPPMPLQKVARSTCSPPANRKNWTPF